MTAAIVAVVVLLAILGGGLYDVNRRRTAPMITSTAEKFFAYPVRPIAAWWQGLWVAVLIAGFIVIDPAQRAFGFLSYAANPSTETQLAFVLPALTLSGFAGATATSLMKKLSHPGQVRKHPDRAHSPRFGSARRWLFIWRTDLAVGAIAGIVLGWVASLVSVGFTEAAIFVFFLFLFPAAGAVVLARQYWRTGETLAVVTVPKVNGNY